MNIYTSLSYWMFLPEVWVILGILLIAADFTLGADFFLLPIGIAALVMAGLVLAHVNLWLGDTVIFDTWRQVMVWFSVLSVAGVAVIKLGFQRRSKDESDINKY